MKGHAQDREKQQKPKQRKEANIKTNLFVTFVPFFTHDFLQQQKRSFI